MSDDIAFKKADLNYLQSAAKEIGLEVIVPSDIKLAQQNMPRNEGDLEPIESFYLLKIAEKIEAGGMIPRDFAIYLNDRAHTGLPENDVPTTLARKRRVAFNDIVEATRERTLEIVKTKERK